jgi:hypothetical protein
LVTENETILLAFAQIASGQVAGHADVEAHFVARRAALQAKAGETDA